MMEEWWEKYPERFLEECRRMEEHTNAQMCLPDGSKLPGRFSPGAYIAWEEIVTSNSGRRYRISVVCQRSHPYSAPAAWIREPEIRRIHHMFDDGHLCLHDPSITPDETYVLNLRNWACEWIHCYETGDWTTFS